MKSVSAGIKAKSNGRTRRGENVCQKSVFVRDGEKWREMKSSEIGSEIERAEPPLPRSEERRETQKKRSLPLLGRKRNLTVFAEI